MKRKIKTAPAIKRPTIEELVDDARDHLPAPDELSDKILEALENVPRIADVPECIAEVEEHLREYEAGRNALATKLAEIEETGCRDYDHHVDLAKRLLDEAKEIRRLFHGLYGTAASATSSREEDVFRYKLMDLLDLIEKEASDT